MQKKLSELGSPLVPSDFDPNCEVILNLRERTPLIIFSGRSKFDINGVLTLFLDRPNTQSVRYQIVPLHTFLKLLGQ